MDGFWTRTYPITGGRYYRFHAARKVVNVVVPRRSAVVRLLWQDDKGKAVPGDTPAVTDYLKGWTPIAEPEFPTDKEADAEGWTEVSDIYRAPAKATKAVVELHLQWAPDASIDMPVEMDIDPVAVMPFFNVWAKVPFTEDKYIEAVENRPSNRAVTHHSNFSAGPLPKGAHHVGIGPAFPGGPLINAIPVREDGSQLGDGTDDAGGLHHNDLGKSTALRFIDARLDRSAARCAGAGGCFSHDRNVGVCSVLTRAQKTRVCTTLLRRRANGQRIFRTTGDADRC